MPISPNLFTDLPALGSDELATILRELPHLRIERIVSQGQASPEGFWYDQDQHEWVIVLAGAARIQFEDGPIDLKVGDFIDIVAHRKHRVDWTTPDEPTIWLAIFY